MILLEERSIKKWISLQEYEKNDFLNEFKSNKKNKDFNRVLGAIGEHEAERYFQSKGFSISYKSPLDLIITRGEKSCAIDVKTTSQDKWFPKKYFTNKERQLKAFGFSIDEYLRVKILLTPFRIIFNKDDVRTILDYFERARQDQTAK